jgi:anti-sigma factor RsiW
VTKYCINENDISAYIDKALSEKEMVRLRDHFQQCNLCRDKLAVLKRNDTLIHDLPAAEPSAGFDAGFWQKVAELDQKQKHRRRMIPFIFGWKPVLAVAATVMVVFGSVVLYQFNTRPSVEEMFIAEHMDLFGNLELIEQLELYENWDLISTLREQS